MRRMGVDLIMLIVGLAVGPTVIDTTPATARASQSGLLRVRVYEEKKHGTAARSATACAR